MAFSAIAGTMATMMIPGRRKPQHVGRTSVDKIQADSIYGVVQLPGVKVGNTSCTSKVVVRIASAKVKVPKALSQTK